MTQRDGALAFGGPVSAQDRPQPDAMLIRGPDLAWPRPRVAQTSRGPDLDRFVRVLRCFLGDGLLQPLLNASRSSGVAEAGWRGRGFCTDPPIAFSASQPRWGKTAASPSSPAIQAATFERVHSPPSGGGAQRRALSLSSSSGFRTDGLVPFRRRRSPRASRPSALSRASRRSTQRRAYNTVAETSAMSSRRCRALWPEARWPGRAAPRSRLCTSETSLRALTRSDDPPPAPCLASATQGASAYQRPRSPEIPPKSFNRKPYNTPGVHLGGSPQGCRMKPGGSPSSRTKIRGTLSYSLRKEVCARRKHDALRVID